MDSDTTGWSIAYPRLKREVDWLVRELEETGKESTTMEVFR